MKNRIIILLCASLALNPVTGLYGQKSLKKIAITGFFTDSIGVPVAGAIIMVDGEKTANVTGRDGFYKARVSQENNKIAVFTPATGIIEEVIAGRDSINFTFKGSASRRRTDKEDKEDETIDIGYEKVKKEELVIPVGKIEGTKLKTSGYNNIYEMIRGKVPGVVVNGTSIMIRSASSVNMGNEPLFVVDGVPVSTIDNINPQNVKSIEVLKGSAASIYGSRGSNGVILINLLKGKDR